MFDEPKCLSWILDQSLAAEVQELPLCVSTSVSKELFLFVSV